MRLGLVLGEVWQGFRRNLSMVISVILVTFISLTFVGAAVLLQMQIGLMKGYWYDRAQVAVYLCTDFVESGNCSLAEATAEQKAFIEQQLDTAPLSTLISHYEFETHEQAYENYLAQFGESGAASFVVPEFLPETFWVTLHDPEQSAALVERLSGVAGVEEVFDQREYLQPIFDALNAASYTAIGIAILMLVAAVLLIATTIRLSAFSRRRELGIMRLVGASNRFIQTPFVLEGMLAALIGAVLAGGAVVAIVHFFVQGYLAVPGGSTPYVGLDDAFIVVPILIAVGAGLAMISAAVAIRRYLHV